MLAPRFPRGIDVVDLSALLLFAGALLIAAGSPGPSIAALVARVVTAGWRGVLPFIAAMWIGEAIWLSLAVWGLAAVAESLHLLFTVIKYAGVAYLLYLAWPMWFDPFELFHGALPHAQSRARSPLKPFPPALPVT